MPESENHDKHRAGEVVALLSELIERASVTPDDAGCQASLAERLAALGFACESMPFGEVTNLWARRGTASPVFCFAGHTDVVPPGDLASWRTPPFRAVREDGMLAGRGAADMKGSIAAMVVALEHFLARHDRHAGSIALLLTSDEEGPAIDGTAKVIDCLEERGERIDFALVGEPSSSERLGDVIRVGRRGSLSATLTVRGVQGHAAYPQLADNPIHRFAPVLDALCTTAWDSGSDQFPPTSFQMIAIDAGAGAPNVTPRSLSAEFNLRFSDYWTSSKLQEKIIEIIEMYELDYDLEWTVYGEPFLTPDGELTAAVEAAVHGLTGESPVRSTGGGTSDGRFIAPTGAQVVELGPVNATIHQANETVAVDDLATLSRVYERVLELLLVR